MLPSYLQPAVEQMEAGDLTAVYAAVGVGALVVPLSASFRFRPSGGEHGLLIGFRPDAVRLVIDGRPVPADDCILAVYKGPLDPGWRVSGTHSSRLGAGRLGRRTPERPDIRLLLREAADR